MEATAPAAVKAENVEDGATNSADAGDSRPTRPTEDEPYPLPEDAPEEKRKRVAYFHAAKSGKREVEEGERQLADYMALPLSQYSVLDAKRVERLDESTFKCYVSGFRFFGFVVEPIVTVDVKTSNRGCFIRMLDCELDGSSMVKAANEAFDARMSNNVTWEQEGDQKRLLADTEVKVAILIPKAFALTPVSLVESVGNAIMGQVLRIAVPRFLRQLDKDYTIWAAGDDSRKPVEV
ncbi:unnamed protein product [Ostreobium quekettii]|uniref:DUF1997 domain-containing protein n=1 Tax=Ostreobium quekettii TaxID=121088 RepID=A0A8S1J385_9CHLO|nr:unnamed protein product [Ostreobium quekettii]|eukprot:evm.model.scf_626EXC.4 EVM.evm.TU.scf_626EXC.4   scf_626EXC:23839-26396(-)